MSTIYKPNSKNTGALCSFEFSKDQNTGKPILWLNMVKQSSWDSSLKRGSFKNNAKDPSKSLVVKLSGEEAASISAALGNNCTDWDSGELDFFHSSSRGSTSIKLSYSEREYKGKVIKGFYLSVSSGDVKIGIGILKATEGRLLQSYINSGLNFFNTLSIRDKMEEAKKYSGNSAKTPEEKPASPPPAEAEPKKEEFEESPF